MNKIRPRYFFLICLVMLSGIAQEKQADFSTLSVNLNLAKNVKNSELDDYWDESRAIGVSVFTPYHSGLLKIGITYRPFETIGNDAGIPDFKSFLYFIGWEKSIKLTNKLVISAGPNLGLFQMMFDKIENSTNPTALLYEHEVTFGCTGRLSYCLNKKVNIDLIADYNRVMTKKRINMIYAGAGVSYRMESPQWLIEFLK